LLNQTSRPRDSKPQNDQDHDHDQDRGLAAIKERV